MCHVCHMWHIKMDHGCVCHPQETNKQMMCCDHVMLNLWFQRGQFVFVVERQQTVSPMMGATQKWQKIAITPTLLHSMPTFHTKSAPDPKTLSYATIAGVAIHWDTDMLPHRVVQTVSHTGEVWPSVDPSLTSQQTMKRKHKTRSQQSHRGWSNKQPVLSN